MRYIQKSALIFLAAIAAPTLIAGGPTPRSEIEAVYRKYEAAYKKGDADAIMKMTTSDFKYRDSKGKDHDRKSVTEMMKQSFAMARNIESVKCKINTFSSKGNTATVNCTTVVKINVLDNQKKKHTYESTSVSNDSFVKEGNVWKIKLTEEKSSSAMLDGKKAGG